MPGPHGLVLVNSQRHRPPGATATTRARPDTAGWRVSSHFWVSSSSSVRTSRSSAPAPRSAWRLMGLVRARGTGVSRAASIPAQASPSMKKGSQTFPASDTRMWRTCTSSPQAIARPTRHGRTRLLALRKRRRTTFGTITKTPGGCNWWKLARTKLLVTREDSRYGERNEAHLEGRYSSWA